MEHDRTGDRMGYTLTLYAYPGDFERRGLTRNTGRTAYIEADGRVGGVKVVGTAETQYVVGGARVVWEQTGAAPTRLDGTVTKVARVTIGIGDLIGTTGAVLDLESGELVEASTYLPNGARESYVRNAGGDDQAVAPAPMGFTGKEGDEEVGLTYFGERYLVSRIGRWASPDPLQIDASEGDEPGNSYHYISADLLKGSDALGLQARPPRYQVPPRPMWRAPALDFRPSVQLPPEYSRYREFYERMPTHLREMMHPPESLLRYEYGPGGRPASVSWTGVRGTPGRTISGTPSRTDAGAGLTSSIAVARAAEAFARAEPSLLGGGRIARRAFRRDGPRDWSLGTSAVAWKLQTLLPREAQRDSTMGVSFAADGARAGQILVSRNNGRALTAAQESYLNETFGTSGWSFVKSIPGVSSRRPGGSVPGEHAEPSVPT